jgi:hypothetical protein
MNANETKPCRSEQRLSMDPREDRVLLLSMAYLRTGMDAEDALESALADFESAFATAESA